MPVHNFSSDFSVNEVPQYVGLKQNSHVEGGRTQIQSLADVPVYPYHLEEYLIPGFRSLDDAMKQYWSGMRIPTKDSYRFVRVKIAGGDKSILIWNDDLVGGRARLPVAAISRDSIEANVEKFSPRYHHMATRFLSSRGDQVAKVYRPTPWLVDYGLTVWAEHKADIEYILYQILNRFHPLAEFKMSDGRINGNVQLRYGGSSDASDKESGYDTHAKVRYEISMTAEAWLPLPETIVKTVLGHANSFSERSGTILRNFLNENFG